MTSTDAANRHQRVNRRELLTAGAGLYLAGRTLRAADTSDIIVLGGGLSGLYSAMLLDELGYKVTLLEAQDHVGGRVQTREFGGYLNELGASDIGLLYARIIDMAGRLELPLVPSSIRARPMSLFVGGELMTTEQWESAKVNRTIGDERGIAPGLLESHFINALNPLTELDDWLKPEFSYLDVPLGEYLRGEGLSPAAVKMIGHTYNGNGIERTSALAIFRDATRARVGMQAWKQRREAGEELPPLQQIEGGIQRIPDAMGEKLGDIVRLNQAAAIVEQSGSSVEVTCIDGSRYQAGRLVCAIPLQAMRNIEFRPGLSTDKRRAIMVGESYSTTKFYLRPTEPFWEKDGFEPSMWCDGPVERVFALTDASNDVHTLLVWINGIGSQRIDQLGPDGGSALVLEQLAQMRPASRGKLEVMGHVAWGANPFIGGCGFSYAAGQVNQLAESLPRPEGLLHFAGEHTRRQDYGMESAMASAERVVQEIAAAPSLAT
jgi:monoamine oxidase